MSDDEKIEKAFAPGWLAQSASEVRRETQNWPDWRKNYESRIENPQDK